MVYGGVKFDLESANNPLCVDVQDTISNANNNCTTLTVKGFDTIDQVAYQLFQVTFAQPVDEVFKIFKNIF